MFFSQQDNLLHILSRNCGDPEYQRIIKKILNNTNIDQNKRNKNRERYIDIIKSLRYPLGKLVSKLKSAIFNDSEHSVRNTMSKIGYINYPFRKLQVCTFVLLFLVIFY